MINYGKQYIDKKDIQMVSDACKSDLLTQGFFVKKFENNLQNKFKTKYACAVSNGTAAIFLALKALEIKKNFKVISSPITFFSSVYSIMMNNLTPDFCDIENTYYNLDVNILEAKLKKDKKIKAIIAVDYAGHPCDWEYLNYLKKKYKIYLINDNCHSFGSTINKEINYASKYADLVTHSYHPVKHITTGEGGSILTNNKKLYDRINILRNHGIIRSKLEQKKLGRWFYNVKNFGFNFRISDIQCALGISQLKKLNFFLKKRSEIAKYYKKNLQECEYIILPKTKKNFTHTYHLYPIQINFKKLRISKIDFFNIMAKNNIFLQTHYIPVYRQKFLKKFHFKYTDFPNSENFYCGQVSLPIYYTLSKNTVAKISNLIKKIINSNVK